MLLGRQESGAGLSSRIIPIFLTQRGTASLYELDIQVLRFVDPKGPGERALNAITQSLLDAVPRTPDEDTHGRTWEQRESMRVSYASPRLLSVQADFSSYSGGAHGSSGTKNFNIDLTNGKVLSIEDIFPPSALGGLRRQCREQIIAQKRRSRPTESYDPASDDFLSDDRIATHIAGLDNWSFGAAGGIVSFGEYVIGAYAEGSFECRFPLADLNALALPGAPLPTTNGVGTTAASEKVPIYFAAKLAPTDNVPPEAPLCYKFMVSDLDEQLRKLKAKYRSLYGDTILTNPDGSKTLLAKRQDETGKEVSYFYSTSPSACNEYQNNRFGTGQLYPTPDVDALNAGAKRPAAPITDDPIMARINGIAYSLGVFRIFYIERILATKSEDTAEFQSQVFNEFVNLVITAQEAERLKLNDRKDVKTAIDKQRETVQGNENATNAMELERLKVLSSVALQAMTQGFEITESELNKAHVQHTRHTDELVKLRAGARIELNEDVVTLKR